MSNRRSFIQWEVTLSNVRLIQDNPRTSQLEIASHIVIRVGTVHYCITSLAGKRLIKLGNF